MSFGPFGTPLVVQHLSASLDKLPDIDDLVQRTREVAKFVSLDAALNDQTWLSTKSPPHPLAIPPYLMLFGYNACDARQWMPDCDPWPQLSLRVETHAEINDHTWYLIKCSLSMDGATEAFQWRAARRLCHLRKLWYDHVKRDLGHTYSEHFARAHFARHGAVVGTSSRLNAWCIALTSCINAGRASPYVVALTLRILDAPHLIALDTRLSAADLGIDRTMKHVILQDAHAIASCSKAEKENTIPASDNCNVPSPAKIGAVDLKEIGVEINDCSAFCINRHSVQTRTRENAVLSECDEREEHLMPSMKGHHATNEVWWTSEYHDDELSIIVADEGALSNPAPRRHALLSCGLSVIEEEKTDYTLATSQGDSFAVAGM